MENDAAISKIILTNQENHQFEDMCSWAENKSLMHSIQFATFSSHSPIYIVQNKFLEMTV